MTRHRINDTPNNTISATAPELTSSERDNVSSPMGGHPVPRRCPVGNLIALCSDCPRNLLLQGANKGFQQCVREFRHHHSRLVLGDALAAQRAKQAMDAVEQAANGNLSEDYVDYAVVAAVDAYQAATCMEPGEVFDAMSPMDKLLPEPLADHTYSRVPFHNPLQYDEESLNSPIRLTRSTSAPPRMVRTSQSPSNIHTQATKRAPRMYATTLRFRRRRTRKRGIMRHFTATARQQLWRAQRNRARMAKLSAEYDMLLPP